jgi:hypothetical protein
LRVRVLPHLPERYISSQVLNRSSEKKTASGFSRKKVKR